MAELLNILTYLFFLFSLVLHTCVSRLFPFYFLCTLSLCLNNCKMKRSKQCTLFEFDVFAKTKKWEGMDIVVVCGTYVKLNYLSTLCRYQCATVGKVDNRYVWRGGQTEKIFRRFAPNFIKQMFAHPGLKPCRRP